MQIFLTLKANKSPGKEIKCLLMQKKIQVTSMDDNNADKPGNKYRSMYDLLDFVLDPLFCIIVQVVNV